MSKFREDFSSRNLIKLDGRGEIAITRGYNRIRHLNNPDFNQHKRKILNLGANDCSLYRMCSRSHGK